MFGPLANAFFAAITMAAVAMAPPASAQGASLIDRARAALAETETFQDKETFRLVGQPKAITFKNNDEETEFLFTIDPKKDYRLLGYCDDYCDGVDMFAETANGDDIGKDQGDEPTAEIDVAPNASGSKVKASLYPGYCARDTCIAAVALFEVLQ
ncbi:MAG: hypothetical protein Q8R02_12015 [Hyphomonadaceae bacterium]|nr:hypothetical protein [Hyphomonadaceae bacterium]